ncbi:MAG: glycoside hydrolase family 3 C-terminal domain-containing protein [Erysipelotrichaceae bacterium]|nr:glycoside hydrolase family 3 C-terminal domain-containing protein [Erysipelotrichaceae bacterium]
MTQLYEEAHLKQLRPYLAECCVLLKHNGAFPLEKPCDIACFGNGVRNTVKGGTGSGEVNSRYFINIEEGLISAGFTITNPQWSSRFAPFAAKAKEAFRQEIKAKAKAEKTNVIIASMGTVMKEPEYDIELDLSAKAAVYVLSRISGEGNDRTDSKGDYQLTDSEVRDILALDEHYGKFMLVINAGGPVDLTPVLSVKNVLVLSQLGVETGHALADILLGKQNPSGRLTTSWAAYKDYCDFTEFGNKDDTRYKEGIYVGYRYFDACGRKPLFPFGYGLSYTDFETTIKKIKVIKGIFILDLMVRNTGNTSGKEVVQIYLSAPQGKLDKEVKSLVAFKKTRCLKPGQRDELVISFNITDFASYDTEKESYLLEKGRYVLLLGKNSEEVTPVGVYQLDQDFVVRKARNLFGKPDFDDYKGERKAEYDVAGLPVEKIDLSEYETQTVSYDHQGEIYDCLRELSDEELAYLNVGSFDPKGGLLSIIGNASQSVPGAAGESTSLLKHKGIDNLIMADGPAGLRLAKEYIEDAKGRHAVGSVIPEGILDVMPKIVKWFMTRKPKVKKGSRLFEQFTTALPIETAIAQSWNTDFARLCGDIVGREMEIFKVDLWLAPALNIHRNVLCGRNFEYLSEDPLLSGKFASAITIGVQAHKGCGVTLKHFACNNQETNRYANNSQVSERALREIYLKGFGICIKEADPAAVMTSYNLLNGTHTSESHALTTEYLRDEVGFKGLVMTDWVIGGGMLTKDPKYPAPDAAKEAAAGGSLFMPGSKNDYEQIIAGLKNEKVTREQLMINATWLLKVSERLHKQ